jgi:cyclophilin family peptidyl-prolyl cis-trans isomerase
MRLMLVAAAFLLTASAAMAQGSPPPADASQPPPSGAAQPMPQSVTPVPVPTNPVMTGPKILIATSMGDIILQLDGVRAPKSVANILRYVKEKHYDGTVFYRVAKGFVIQMGSWEAHMKGRGIHPGPVALEADNGLRNLRGTVALARAEEPTSATAEFFINLADNPALDHAADDPGNTSGYAVFGQVVSGMDVVDRIAEGAVGDDGPMPGQAPVDPVLIKKVTLLK